MEFLNIAISVPNIFTCQIFNKKQETIICDCLMLMLHRHKEVLNCMEQSSSWEANSHSAS
jgi:hypothetical protein